MLLTTDALLPFVAASAIDESIDYVRYPVRLQQQSLADALDRATPVRVGGAVYHGYAEWRVDWTFGWDRAADGRCIVTGRNVRLRSRITLPSLAGAARPLQHEFDRYLGCLTEHELGHVALGRRAAERIDHCLATLAADSDPACLAERGNRAAQAILVQHRELERQYDIDTGHSRTQGVWLPDGYGRPGAVSTAETAAGSDRGSYGAAPCPSL